MDKLYWQKKITRYITGESSEEEKNEVQIWMDEDPANREVFERYLKAWKIAGDLDFNVNEERIWINTLKSISESQPKTANVYKIGDMRTLGDKQKPSYDSSKSRNAGLNWIFRIAVVLLLTVGTSYLVFEYELQLPVTEAGSEPAKIMREIVTNKGEKVTVTFSDGTKVTVNSSSILRFPEKFTNTEREVELLKGEAFFSVVNNEDTPFKVQTGSADIQVLGTKFIVNAHEGNSQVEVVVAEGRVSVRSNGISNGASEEGESEEFVLTKGEYVNVDRSSFLAPPRKVKLKAYLGWVNGMLVFDDAPLKEVLVRLSNYYNVEFGVSDPILFERRLTAVFDRESMDKVIDVISLSTDMDFTQNEGKIIFEPAESEQE